MTVYLGYYRTVPGFTEEGQERARRGDRTPDATFIRLIQDLTDQLPAGCRILGSYVPAGGAVAVLADPGLPAVMLVETDNADDLAVISRYYTGYLSFLWTPATVVGATRPERDAWAGSVASAGGTPR